MKLEQGINNLWATPVMYTRLDPEVYQDVLTQAMTTDLSDPISDLSGRTFDTPSFDNKVLLPIFEKYLNEAFNVSVKDYRFWKFKKWLTGNHHNYQTGYAMQPHNHSNSQISGVLYMVAEGDEPGTIVFIDPRHSAKRSYDEPFAHHFADLPHKPVSGDLILFPSFLWHYVYPTFANLRLAMPIDLFLQP